MLTEPSFDVGILCGVNNGVLYRCNSNCERIFVIAADGLLRLAPATI